MKYPLISDQVKWLDLDLNQLIVVGSGILQELGLRQAHDIDLVVLPTIMAKLDERTDFTKSIDLRQLTVYHHNLNNIEVWDRLWNFKTNLPIFYPELLANSVAINDVRFLSLEYLRQWKIDANRPKDAADIKLIDDYLAKNR